MISFLGKNFVTIETQIMDILEVNDKEFSVTMTMYFNVQWDEPRIETNNTFSKGEMVPIDMMFLNHLWIPNIFIYDLREFAPLSVLKKLAGMYAQQLLYPIQITDTTWFSLLQACGLWKANPFTTVKPPQSSSPVLCALIVTL